MKLSEIRGVDCVDVLADLISPVTAIATDPELARGIVAVGKDTQAGVERRKAVIAYLREQVPTLIKRHRDDVVAILATLNGTDADTYAENLTPYVLLRDLLEVLSDGEFVGFFSSAASDAAASASTSTNGDQGDAPASDTSSTTPTLALT